MVVVESRDFQSSFVREVNTVVALDIYVKLVTQSAVAPCIKLLVLQALYWFVLSSY